MRLRLPSQKRWLSVISAQAYTRVSAVSPASHHSVPFASGERLGALRCHVRTLHCLWTKVAISVCVHVVAQVHSRRREGERAGQEQCQQRIHRPWHSTARHLLLPGAVSTQEPLAVPCHAENGTVLPAVSGFSVVLLFLLVPLSARVGAYVAYPQEDLAKFRSRNERLTSLKKAANMLIGLSRLYVHMCFGQAVVCANPCTDCRRVRTPAAP